MDIPIYIINLKREHKRKKNIIQKLKSIGIYNYYFIDAIDGNNIEDINFKVMDNWLDPVEKRVINCGEIGCFLSHHKVWCKIVDDEIERAIILEDDNVFNTGFNETMEYILNIDSNLYDLFYISRIKNNAEKREYNINGFISVPTYSYNCNAYMLTLRGAKKLVNTNCLNNVIPVDEYVPIMYDKDYPYLQYSSVFSKYDKLIALSINHNITEQESREDYPSSIIKSCLYK